jgi:hypothetical protein
MDAQSFVLEEPVTQPQNQNTMRHVIHFQPRESGGCQQIQTGQGDGRPAGAGQQIHPPCPHAQ